MQARKSKPKRGNLKNETLKTTEAVNKKGNKRVAKSFSIEELASIFEMLERNGVAEFELTRGDEKIKIKRKLAEIEKTIYRSSDDNKISSEGSSQKRNLAPVFNTARTSSVASNLNNETSTNAEESQAAEFTEVSSPMVGTFYVRPSPDSKPYVEVGDTVKKGQTLCIVEAMKLMNEIESDYAGKIVEICLEDSQMVEYGEVLFRIDQNIS